MEYTSSTHLDRLNRRKQRLNQRKWLGDADELFAYLKRHTEPSIPSDRSGGTPKNPAAE